MRRDVRLASATVLVLLVFTMFFTASALAKRGREEGMETNKSSILVL